MAKPQTKTVRAQLPTGPELLPAPGNGVDYVDRQAPAPVPEPAAVTASPAKPVKESVRSYPQLGTRVPPALYERIQRCCAETGVTQAFLVQRGLERELADRGY
jgi:hypothetical protein